VYLRVLGIVYLRVLGIVYLRVLPQHLKSALLHRADARIALAGNEGAGVGILLVRKRNRRLHGHFGISSDTEPGPVGGASDKRSSDVR
jgi:hypothetical protein